MKPSSVDDTVLLYGRITFSGLLLFVPESSGSRYTYSVDSLFYKSGVIRNLYWNLSSWWFDEMRLFDTLLYFEVQNSTIKI